MDNQIKNKLNDLQPSFNEADWQDMEARLDEDKKRRGAIWWWYGGVGVLLVLVAAGLLAVWLLPGQTNQQPVAPGHTTAPSATNNSAGEGADITGQQNNSTANINKAEASPSVTASASIADAVNNKATADVTPAADAGQPSAYNSTPEASNTTTTVGANKQDAAGQGSGGIAATTNNANAEVAAQTLTMLAMKATQRLATLPIPKSDSSLFSELPDEPESIERQKRVQYSISLGGGITNSFIQPAKLYKPGYSAGMEAEFLFADRFGISTGLYYGLYRYQRDGLDINSGQAAAIVVPNAYTSSIKTLEVPLSFKYYFVQQPRVSVYGFVGVSNFIRLEETYDYSFPPVDTTVSSTTTDPEFVNFPSQNNFSPGTVSLDELFDSQGSFGSTSGGGVFSDRSRYLAAMHVGAGIEYRFNERLSMGLEPRYLFSLTAMGLEDRRLQSVSMNARLRIRLGR